MHFPFRRKPRVAAVRNFTASNSLFQLWANSPEEARRRLPRVDAFTPFEISTAALWSARQTSNGLRADLRSEQILEVFGPDDLVPHCIVYPTEDGVQIDEFDGGSQVYPCLETALHCIAPI